MTVHIILTWSVIPCRAVSILSNVPMHGLACQGHACAIRPRSVHDIRMRCLCQQWLLRTMLLCGYPWNWASKNCGRNVSLCCICVNSKTVERMLDFSHMGYVESVVWSCLEMTWFNAQISEMKMITHIHCVVVSSATVEMKLHGYNWSSINAPYMVICFH